MEFTEPLPFEEAIRIASERGLLPTNLSSAQIAEWDDELKRLSVFSARTNHAGYLQEIKDQAEALLKGEWNEATARAFLQDKLDALNYHPRRGGFPGLEDQNIPPAEPGSLRDLSSDKRTQLVVRTQMRQMANRGYREQGTTPGALFQFPAWEFVRIYPRLQPRNDWLERWAEAGGELYAGRMIAEKSSPVWAAMGSRALFSDAIGTDYPPFWFNSGGGWRQVSRGICEKLGVIISDEQKIKAAPKLDDVQMAANFDPEFLRGLRADLDLEIREGVAKLRVAPAAAELPSPVPLVPRAASTSEIAFSPGEKKALSAYTDNDVARSLNARLWAGDQSALDDYPQLLPALDRLPAQRGVEVYRAINLTDAQLSRYRDHVSEMIAEPAFISTSRLPMLPSFPGNTFFSIRSESGRDISSYSLHPGQQEILFRRGSQFRVVDFREENGRYFVALEEVE